MTGLPSPLVVLCAGITSKTPSLPSSSEGVTGVLIFFLFLYRASFPQAVQVCRTVVSPLSFPCCLWLKKMCVHVEALQPRSQRV